MDRTWLRHAHARIRREPVIAALAGVTLLGLVAVGAAEALAATAEVDPPTDDPRVVTVGAAGLTTAGPGARAVVEPRRDHRFALTSSLRERARHLLEILGYDPGDEVDSADILHGATELGVAVTEPVTSLDVEEMLAAHRERAVRPLRAIGIDVGSSPGHSELKSVAGELGVDTGRDVVTPRQVQRIIRAANGRPTAVFASTGGVPIHTPTRHLQLIGFHQASFAAARQMTAHERVPTTTLPSRGRATGSRSAADVSMTNGRPVIAPVTGRVVEVQRYALYGRYADARVRIVPDANPQMLVTVLHVTDPTVRVGSRVQGGKHTIARSATKFPFVSQIDDVAGDHPHVHIEVRRR